VCDGGRDEVDDERLVDTINRFTAWEEKVVNTVPLAECMYLSDLSSW
jgi:hypothetical protein